MIKPILVFYAVNEKKRMMICDLETDEAVLTLLSMLVRSQELCFLFTEQAKKHGDYANIDYVVNDMYGVKFLYNSKTKKHHIMYTSFETVYPNHQEKPKMNEEQELKYKFNENDNAYFVSRDTWTIISATITERKKLFDLHNPRHYVPGYRIRLLNGSTTEVFEEWLFSSKRDAVGEIIRLLKGRIGEHRKAANHLQGILDNFQSANFQMRYMGEVIE